MPIRLDREGRQTRAAGRTDKTSIDLLEHVHGGVQVERLAEKRLGKDFNIESLACRVSRHGAWPPESRSGAPFSMTYISSGAVCTLLDTRGDSMQPRPCSPSTANQLIHFRNLYLPSQSGRRTINL